MCSVCNTGFLGQDQPASDQPEWRPPGQRGAAPHRRRQTSMRPSNERIHAPSNRGGNEQTRGHALPQTVRRPRDILPPVDACGADQQPDLTSIGASFWNSYASVAWMVMWTSAGSPAGAGRGDHSLPRAPTRGTPRPRRRSAPSVVNAIRIGSRTATAIATEIGTPGWGRWNCASPRSEWAATSLRQRRTAVRATQRDSAAGGDPAGPCGRGIHQEDGQSDIGTCNFGELGLLQHLSGLQGLSSYLWNLHRPKLLE